MAQSCWAFRLLGFQDTMPLILNSQTVGLFNGTLYDVLQGHGLRPGIANVSAAGINISCGYVPPENINVTARDPFQFTLSLAPIGLDETEGPIVESPSLLPLILWTTLEVQDSSGNTGSPVMVDRAKDPDNVTINQLQVLQCSKSIVAQSALVDTKTTRVNSSSIYPSIYKTESTWGSSLDPNSTAEDSTLLGSNVWSQILTTGYNISDFFTNIEENLMGSLGLDPLGSMVNSLQLHDIENRLSSLVATTFWIDAITMQSSATNVSGIVTPAYVPPVLPTGTTMAQQVRTLVRLNVWCGFGTSVILLILSAFSIRISRGTGGKIPGPGILQAIWWSQENAEDIDFLENVYQPTELNLRFSGRTISTVNWPKVICIILHMLLMLVHGIVLWIRATDRDHQIVFRLSLQGVVSLWYKIMSTVIGTPSRAFLNGLTQIMSTQLCRATISYLQNDAEFLEYLGTLELSQTVGLFNSTLYDTLTDVYANGGLINTSATGFEVTCGYLSGEIIIDGEAINGYNVSFGQFGWTLVVAPAGPDVVTLRAMYPGSGLQDPGLSDSIIVYTTNEVLDSAGNRGRYLVPQSAQVDPGSRTIMPDTLNPVIFKTQSNWLSSADLPPATDGGSSLINSSSWANILSELRGSGVWIDSLYPTWGDVFIMDELGLQPGVADGIDVTTNRTVYLHEIENALSNLIASVFWIAGHIRPPPLTMKYGFQNGSVGVITANVQKPPILEQKSTTLTQTVPAAKLNVSPLAAYIGLA
ncbi:hypothetical protein C8R45DRAFT_935649 [Mycena sanguinolenta]|nr:hypothetical protein C8R45DRAFT_935649 [Mycena sanguinolenta]